MSRVRIHHDLPTLKPTDKLAAAALLIEESKLGGLPIVHEHHLIGTLLEEELELLTDGGEKNLEKTIQQFPLHAPTLIDAEAHVYHAMRLFGRINHHFLPVVGSDERYQGVVLRDDTVTDFFDLFTFSEGSVILEVEIPAAQFRMSDMVRVLEQNETIVLSINSYASPSDTDLRLVTMTVQSRDFFRLYRTLERYGYTVTYSSSKEVDPTAEDFADKAKALMKYLEM
jgi:acetoin utilization protein AcuB